ncbi:MAG: PAS domain S-box protein, partial [Candidatus Marinimicrobia bacterium]|nr:PAS domain S-box protein [Candidatus Neomarinimicrobiota bacterium]
MISFERINTLRENPRVRMPILAAFFGSLYWIIDTLFTHSMSSQQLIHDAFLSTVPANGLVFRLLALFTFIGVGYHIGSRIHSSQIKEEEYESLIQTTHDGFCVIDSNSYIVKVNKALADILGYTEKELIGVPLNAINPSNNIREIIEIVSAGNNQYSKQYETKLLQHNGTLIDVVIRTISLKNEKGRTGIFFRDITEQKHTINTLWMKERRYNSLFENMTTGFALLDVIKDVTNDPTDFRFLKINKRFTELTGLGPEVIGEKASQMVPLIDSDANEWITSFYHVAKIGNEESFEAYCGDLKKWFHISAYRPEVGKVATLFQDITQRKKAELKLQSERKFLKKLANTSPIGIIEVDATGKIQFVNERGAEIMEVSAADMIGMQFNDPVWDYRLHDGSPFPEEMLPYQQVKGFRKSIKDIQVILEKESGERSYLSVNATPLFDQDGAYQGSVSTIEEITERVQVELALKRNQDLLVSTQAVAKIGGWEIDTESRFISWTAETHRIFDIPVQNEFDLEFGLSFFQGDAKQTLSSVLTAAMEDGKPFDLELPAEVENNKLGWIRIIGEPVWEQDSIIKVRGIIQDITSRKKIEAEQYRIYTAVEQLSEALVLTDADLNIQYVNRGFEEMTGFTEDGVLGKNLFDIQFEDLQDEKYAEILDSLQKGVSWSEQIQQAGKDGAVIEMDATISPVYKENSTG